MYSQYTQTSAEQTDVEQRTSDLTKLTAQLLGHEMAVAIPAKQALVLACVSALFAGMLAASIALVAHNYRLWWAWAIGAVLLTFGAVLFGAAWYGFHVWRDDRRRMIDLVETIYGVDIDGDGEIGDLEPQTTRVEVFYREHSGSPARRTQMFDLPASMSELRQLATGILNGDGFSDATWGGSGKLFSQPRFIRLRTEMEQRGLIRRKGQAVNSGFEFTRPGLDALKTWAGRVDLPSPIEGGDE